MATVTLKQRFFAKVAPPNADGCMVWTGAVHVGYGRFNTGRPYGTQFVLAHRFGYEMWVGPIPAGLQLDHLCRVPACVAPDHLEPVTPHENVRRSGSPAARNAAKTHCPEGHPLSGDNLHPVDLKAGRRQCRICRTTYQREYDRSRRKVRQRGAQVA